MLNDGVVMTNISSPSKSQKYLLRMSYHRQPTHSVPEATSPLSILQKGITQPTEARAFFFPWCNRISRTQVMGELRLPGLPPPRPRYYHINFLCSSKAASRREANGKCVWNEIRKQPDPCCLETKGQILKQEAKQPQSRAKYPSTFQSLLKLQTQSIGNWPGGRASGLCRNQPAWFSGTEWRLFHRIPFRWWISLRWCLCTWVHVQALNGLFLCNVQILLFRIF